MAADDSGAGARLARHGGKTIHHLKGLAVLLAAVSVLVGSVAGLRVLIAPDQPTFADRVSALDEGEEEAFIPNAYGGELRVSGDREGQFSLTGEILEGTGFGLGGDDGRVYFTGTGDELAISQFSYDGLEFFPKGEECVIEPGEVNTQAGVGAARVECTGVQDIRQTASISVEGHVGIPAAMVATDLPTRSGTVTLGEVEFVVDPERLFLFTGGTGIVGDEGSPGFAAMSSGDPYGVSFSYEQDEYTVAGVFVDDTYVEMPPGSCTVEASDVTALSPETVLVELTFECTPVDLGSLGEVPVSGELVVEQSGPPPPGP